ncbi:MAG: hypothetical protein KY439_03250 [Actinobacteria bacterium]|nr:hypothetical protein [Actinomycetota bacterium]
MIVVQIRMAGAGTPSLPLHHALTVVGGLDRASRTKLAAELPRALRGEPSEVEIEVEVDGKREWLTPELARRLGLERCTAEFVVEAAALPGASLPPPPEPTTAPEAVGAAASVEAAATAEAARSAAEATVGEAEAALAQAQAAATEADAALAAATAAGGAGERAGAPAGGSVAEAQKRLEQVRRELEAAREALAEAERATSEQEQAGAQLARKAEVVERLVGEQAELEQARAELVARLAASTAPADPAPVEQALVELRRVRSVKPRPSVAAKELADRWAAAQKKLAELPAPPEPPEWLVTPAMAALHDAREALARADASAENATPDARLVDALDRAHRQVLDAEQKMMRKGSRLHRRRLDQAYEAEQDALRALGVATYGEYLQRMAPGVGGPSAPADPTAAARSALADAEAVWEELHGGLASPEWTAAKEEVVQLRAEAHELLGRDVPDAALEAALRAHEEATVDVRSAEEALADALAAGAGADASFSEPDLEAAAERWLAEAPTRNEARVDLERQLAELDERLAAVGAEVAEHQADVFFGAEETAAGSPGPGADGGGPTDTALAAVHKADQDVRDAEAALARLEEQAADLEQQRRRRSALEEEATAARGALRAADSALGDARLALDAARGAAAAAASAATPPEAPVAERASEQPEPDLGAVTALEVQLYLLARLAAVQGAPEGPLPLFMDATAVAGVPEAVGRKVLAVLERAAGAVQVVLLGDDAPVEQWAKDKGKAAAVVAATGSA